MELSLNDFMDSAPPFEASISSYEVRMDIPTDKAMLHWLIDKEYRNAFRTAANLDPTEYPKGWTDFFLNMTMADSRCVRTLVQTSYIVHWDQCSTQFNSTQFYAPIELNWGLVSIWILDLNWIAYIVNSIQFCAIYRNLRSYREEATTIYFSAFYLPKITSR